MNADSAGIFVVSSGWVRERSTTGRREELGWGGGVVVQLDKYH